MLSTPTRLGSPTAAPPPISPLAPIGGHLKSAISPVTLAAAPPQPRLSSMSIRSHRASPSAKAGHGRATSPSATPVLALVATTTPTIRASVFLRANARRCHSIAVPKNHWQAALAAVLAIGFGNTAAMACLRHSHLKRLSGRSCSVSTTRRCLICVLLRFALGRWLCLPCLRANPRCESHP